MTDPTADPIPDPTPGQWPSAAVPAHDPTLRRGWRRSVAGLRIGIVGVGRVGAVLGAALSRRGLDVVAGYGVSDASLARAAALLPGVPLVAPDGVAARADLLLLTVPDDPLPGLVEGLAAGGAFRPGQIVVHTSGRHGLAALAPAARAGAATLALHPAMTFTGSATDLDRLPGCAFGTTAPARQTALARAIVEALGGVPVRIAESDRVLYHGALAHGANHLVTLVSDAMDLLARSGVPDPAATLRPLLQAALDNALADGDAALTGPVARGDAGTVAAHIAEIRRVEPDAVDPYLALARRTAARAVASGRLRPMDADALLDVLGDVSATAPRSAQARPARHHR